ncbi:MAG: hypothetical protein AAF685_13715 [Cyanobacteria bacterium P01_C01_bin.89]
MVDKSALLTHSPTTQGAGQTIQVPLGSVYFSGYESYVDTANQINAFLNDPSQTTFETELSHLTWIVVIFGGLFLLTGLGVVLMSPVTVFHMDSLGNQFKLEKRRLWGKKAREVPLRDVAGPRIDRSWGGDGNSLRLGIELKSGEMLWLGVGYDNINNGQKYRISDMVSEFLSYQINR